MKDSLGGITEIDANSMNPIREHKETFTGRGFMILHFISYMQFQKRVCITFNHKTLHLKIHLLYLQ